MYVRGECPGAALRPRRPLPNRARRHLPPLALLGLSSRPERPAAHPRGPLRTPRGPSCSPGTSPPRARCPARAPLVQKSRRRLPYTPQGVLPWTGSKINRALAHGQLRTSLPETRDRPLTPPFLALELRPYSRLSLYLMATSSTCGPSSTCAPASSSSASSSTTWWTPA